MGERVRAVHITSDKQYRDPFGAAPVGGVVTLRIDVWDDAEAVAELRVWEEGEGETLVKMAREEHEGGLRFSAKLDLTRPAILWYSFNITAGNGDVWRYGARFDHPVGEGDFAYGEPPSFQLTVYERSRGILPDWYTGGIVYQIFPDRFARGEGWHERAAAALAPQRKGPKRRLVEDWDRPVAYERAEDGSIASWDFYGGTLEGVRERLDYLAALGITVIYLNPIFEAASNHRYDTADYLAIDPMLGSEEDFRRLCKDAAEKGISIILDGVFNHTGADSRYFNMFGNYPEIGAWQSEESPFRTWYKIDEDGHYTSWWGVADMPDLDEDNPDYRQLICGRDGVVRKWLRAGARGWRLDVADELPDDFIADIKSAELTEKSDALLLGEVWEDATTKYAYGKLRHYFWGDELDGTMNYPLRTGVLSFIANKITAPELASRLEALYENYPKENFYAELNLLGSHDRMRLLTALGNAPEPGTLGDEQKAAFRLDEGHRNLAISRLWVAALMQMTLPGVPSVYYGDEAGLEGYADPYNRGTFPWGQVNQSCFTIYRNAIAMRKAMPVFVDGDFRPFAVNDDVFGYWRMDATDCVCVLINASLEHSHTVRVPMLGEEVDDVVSGRDVTVVTVPGSMGSVAAGGIASGGMVPGSAPADPAGFDGGLAAGGGTVPGSDDSDGQHHREAEVFLWPLGTSVLHFHKRARLQASMERGVGVLCHVTSIPNLEHPDRKGTLGASCKRFIDYLADAGVKYWQVLPVNPTDEFGSPYAGLSAFAGNPYLLDGFEEGPTDFSADFEESAEYRRFCENNEAWLIPYATFRAIKDFLGDSLPWQKWPEKYKEYRKELSADPNLHGAIERRCRMQFEFMRQWDEIHEYANERGVSIIGDMPMYVSADSSDVWSHRDIFMLDEDGNPDMQAGTPPDSFAPDGQLWGNPTYDWDELRRTGYDWWLRRFERAFELYDYVRLDHFLGFSSYYRVPRGLGAKDGAWHFGPGADLFDLAARKFGPLPVIAEDLGSVTPAARELISVTGFAGMDVMLFSDNDVREGYVPKRGKVCYTSTHDTSTLLGWVKSRFGEDGAEWLAADLRRKALESDADVIVMPLQDILGLDDEARMNVPGTAEDNWSWQASADDVEQSARLIKELVEESGRRS